MRQNSIIKFYFAIIMALMLVSCSKDSEVLCTGNTRLSLEIAKSYFEKCFIAKPLTKSSEVLTPSNKLFYTGDFTPQWDKAKYSRNSVLEGYDVEILLPKYKYVVEREVYDKGKIKTFNVDVTQKLVVLKESETDRMSQ